MFLVFIDLYEKPDGRKGF